MEAGPHPDIAAEAAYLGRAAGCLRAMQARAEQTLAFGERAVREEKTVEARIAHWHLARRKEALAVDAAGLCFGRIDSGLEKKGPARALAGASPTGERFYIGRRHVEDEAGDPVVVDWRAPVAVPFYRATAADPLGLALRRRFGIDGGELVAIFDEHLNDPDEAPGAGIPDPVLAQIERRRTGEMGDIVATIAAEQDVVIRAPIEELLVVQGGPGTGKTAVALHRAAFLLFEHRERLARERVLVLGPSRVFLRYIASVLPSLGETAVTEATLESLYEGTYPVRGSDEPAVAALKGDRRLAAVLARLATDRLSVPAEPARIPVGARVVTYVPADLAAAQETALSRRLPLNQARNVYRELLVRTGWQQQQRRGAEPADEPLVSGWIRQQAEFKRLVDRTWPALSAPDLVRRLLGNRVARGRAVEHLLGQDTAEQLHRRSAPKAGAEMWTAADIPLLDEATALVTGVGIRYGHVVVDEAQDLSAMALRMVGRRATAGSLTVLGDLAQATTPGALGSWEKIVAVLADPDLLTRGEPTIRWTELTVGYRVPGPILDLANGLLAVAAPGITPSRSIRERGEPPLILPVGVEEIESTVAAEVAALGERWSTVGVIAPADLVARLVRSLNEAGLVAAAASTHGLDHPVVVLDPPLAKGLEFDAVVVVEPAAIARLPGGLRLLYIALTRAVQRLGIVHAEPLPVGLAGAAPWSE